MGSPFGIFSHFGKENPFINIPILPMAFLTFAEAKVVAPPIVPMNKLVTLCKVNKKLIIMSHL